MFRRRAIESLLIEEVAGIAGPRGRLPRENETREASGEGNALAAPVPVGREDLAESEKKALRLVGVCWVALLVLLIFHSGPRPFLSFEGVDAVFSLGVLVIAVYSGFRLGQWEKYRSVRRSLEDLGSRAE